MPSDPDILDPREFNLEAARNASLEATLSWVRLCRRVRRGARTGAGVLALAVAAWLAIPGPGSRPGQTRSDGADALVVRTIPLKAEQRIVSKAHSELFVHTRTDLVSAASVTTPATATIPRLGEIEFHRLLAANQVYCLQLANEAPQVLPLYRE